VKQQVERSADTLGFLDSVLRSPSPSK
jgi:hypothetical protein